MARRCYVSSVRTAEAAAKRDRVIGAAARLLREDASIASFSLDAVAKAAGVTRLTVYHQFGSRRGLLEAIFDEIARQGGLVQIPEAMAMPDPRAALDLLVEIFCAFWSSDPAVERRRRTIDVLIRRIAGKIASARARQDVVDMIFALTSFSMFAMLGQNRSAGDVCKLIKAACRDALDALSPDGRSAARRR